MSRRRRIVFSLVVWVALAGVFEGGARLVYSGVEGYSPTNVLYRLDEFQALRPEIVTIYIGWNALFDEQATFGETLRPSIYSVRLFAGAANWFARQWYGDQHLALRAQQGQRRIDLEDPLLSRVSDRIPLFMTDVRTIAGEFKASGSTVVLMTLPGLYTTDQLPSPEALSHLPTYTTNPRVLAELSQSYNQALRALASQEGVGLIDLAEWSRRALQPREDYFFASVHLHDHGQEMLGQFLASQLASRAELQISELAHGTRLR